MTDKSPQVSSILKYINVEFIDGSGNVYKLIPDELLSFECFIKRHQFSIYGSLIVYDMVNISSLINFKTCSVKVYYVDLLNNFFFRTFKIININESYNNANNKIYTFKLRDEISYFLSNLYISKSYNISRSSAINSIIAEYKLSDILTKTKVKIKSTDDNILGNLVLNKNSSVLDFFEKEFNRIGYAFYQDKSNLHIVNKDELIPTKLPVISDAFSQLATNPLYKNKIYELITKPIQKEEIDKTPEQISYFYDIETKTMKTINDSISTIQSDLSLNKNTTTVQETTGSKAVFQNRSDNSQQKNDIRDRFLSTSISKIVVNGYVDNDINKVISMELLGHKNSANSQIEGNLVSSGKYVILSVTDRIIGDKMIQLLEVGRSDLGK